MRARDRVRSAGDLGGPGDLGNLWITAKLLRGAYDEWCRRNGETPVGTVQWGAGLTARGCTRDRIQAGDKPRIWRGIELAAEDGDGQ